MVLLWQKFHIVCFKLFNEGIDDVSIQRPSLTIKSTMGLELKCGSLISQGLPVSCFVDGSKTQTIYLFGVSKQFCKINSAKL
jgi:hypothetical protein